MSEIVEFKVIDDWLPASLIRSIKADWPRLDSSHWHRYEDRNSVKYASRGPFGVPRTSMIALEDMARLDPHELLGGMPDSFPDLESLHGAGLHHMEPCGEVRTARFHQSSPGKLALHLDSVRHPTLPRVRNASAVLYLDSSVGGELELGCDEDGNGGRVIATKENRLVIFSTKDNWHKVNECRSVRRSLCLFYWSVGVAASGFDRARFSGDVVS